MSTRFFLIFVGLCWSATYADPQTREQKQVAKDCAGVPPERLDALREFVKKQPKDASHGRVVTESRAWAKPAKDEAAIPDGCVAAVVREVLAKEGRTSEQAKKRQQEEARQAGTRRQEEANREKALDVCLYVGYTAYCVAAAWYSDQLSSNQFLNKRPNAKWLFLLVGVKNMDTKARMVPPFELVDENGAEYESSAEAMMIENAFGVLVSLNPSVMKAGVVVFDVPQNHQYRLKVSGGYWSAEDGFIRIIPGSAPW